MERKVMSKEELLDKKESLIKQYNATHAKSKKPVILTKKERKALGIGKDQGRASVDGIRIPATKVKLVIDLIRGKSLDTAYGIINNLPRAASDILYKLLKSAEANAVNNNELDRDLLYVAEAYANQGPTMKRIRARAQGRANRILKRTSNITVVLKEKDA